MHGRLLFQCNGLVMNATAAQTNYTAAGIAAGSSPSTGDPVSLTVAQAFSLSSRPGAVKKILLDFDGQTTYDPTGNYWMAITNGNSIVTPPYDTDGDPSSWSAGELSDIYAIWRAVAEDFVVFDVDVTTADPGDAALTGNGIRVIIGGSGSW